MARRARMKQVGLPWAPPPKPLVRHAIDGRFAALDVLLIGANNETSIVRLAPAAGVWVIPLRDRYLNDPRRDDSCDGCRTFGLCVLQGTENQ